ncbi:MAG: 2-oxoglutarate dehydrogenase complex dihydrolipoyllysine-residue succinyltransferase [Deltaproteobacteria bacterium]|nr:MAG: 2-oxoglutarate dehydrogenase complex dihydrolipoyllysine-residue succinyltransferase [Deltaproteobacteria bacterium]
MLLEIRIPSVGESVTEGVLAQWYKKDGDLVHKDELLFVLETDKVALEIEAEADGLLKMGVLEGETVAIGAVVGTIDTEVAPEVAEEPLPPMTEELPPSPPPPPTESPVQPARDIVVAPSAEPVLAPSVRRLVAEKQLDISRIAGTGPGGRITKGDVILHLEQTEAAREVAERVLPREVVAVPEEQITRKPMSQIRQRIAKRLLEAKQNTAMLTTFNEIDLSRVGILRTQFRDAFKEKYGVRLGIMSFFIKAAVEALKEFPEINAFIDAEAVLYHNYYHIGVAIGAERGLVVPVIRHADTLSFAELEQAILDYVQKINENRLELADLEGGTFTITNGGVFGSLLSTPILNMPQSGILGMHKIEDRPVAIDGELVIRPMMYVALTYDHRIVDGRQAVTFLVRIKHLIENPERIMMEI